MNRLLSDLGVHQLQPVQLHCDNQFALYIANNLVFHERTKQIAIDCRFTREKVLEWLIELTYLPTTSQLADVLTKTLPLEHFHHLLSKLGMVSTHPSLRGDVEHSKSTSAFSTSAELVHLST